MSGVFLQETEATIVVFDLRQFSRLCMTLAPLELGIALGNYYAFVEARTLEQGGRVVKFAGDMVLSAWLRHEVADPVRQALATVAAAERARPHWQADTSARALPELDFTAAVASGLVLAGHIGTDRHKAFDVLGEPVNTATKLTPVASARGLGHVLAVSDPDGGTVEVEGIDLGGRYVRLFQLKPTGGAG